MTAQARAAVAVLVLAGAYDVAARALPPDAPARQPGGATVLTLATPAARALATSWQGGYPVLDRALAVIAALPTAALAGRAMVALAAVVTRSDAYVADAHADAVVTMREAAKDALGAAARAVEARFNGQAAAGEGDVRVLSAACREIVEAL